MSQTSLIMLIVVLIITAGGALIFFEIVQHFGSPTHIQGSDTIAIAKSDAPTFVNVVTENVPSSHASYVRFQVKYDGDEDLPLNQTLIQMQTDNGTADLRYRNGTLSHDIVTGFYTQ